MRLVVRTTEPLREGPGPTAWTSSWEGELGVEVATGDVVWPGVMLRSSSWGDYTSTYSTCDEVELYDGGRRLRVRTNAWEQFSGDTWSVRECWASADGGWSWRKAADVDVVGDPIDRLRTPPDADRVVTRTVT